jgi:kinetochore protein Spc7/SPC105
LSGIGADRSGLGSPRVAAIFDRRVSIGDSAEDFIPGASFAARKVTFGDHREIEDQVDREQREEENKEDRRKILEKEVNGDGDDREVTLNLKEMIESLSPQKRPLKGRKSLHVGSARGILGKRPAELECDDEDEQRDGVKRLKGLQSSPVKNIKLQKPPSKAETTTGRITRSARRSIEQAQASNVTPSLTEISANLNTTPKDQGRFKDVKEDKLPRAVNFADAPACDDGQLDTDAQDERMHLQDFLNMISVRFMELNTTKRRHTMAPPEDGTHQDLDADMSLERCVVAGACTVPTLELYQHVRID